MDQVLVANQTYSIGTGPLVLNVNEISLTPSLTDDPAWTIHDIVPVDNIPGGLVTFCCNNQITFETNDSSMEGEHKMKIIMQATQGLLAST